MSETGSMADQSTQSLDDVMLAMDVVDTLRHREQWVFRELDAEAREAQLITRLREIYTAQGIEVPDAILREGVKALEENRFVYEPPKPSLMVSLAKIYVGRGQWGKPVAGVGAAIIAAFSLFQIGIAGPARDRAAQEQVALEQTLPAELASAREAVQAASDNPDALTIAETLYQEGLSAVAAGDADLAEEYVGELETFGRDINTSYSVRIVSRPGETSGVTRIPDDVNAENFYLIVEAVSVRGDVLQVPISSEEDQSTQRVSQWGQRVTEAVFNSVLADKSDDQIIQNDIIGTKRAGDMVPQFSVDVLDGAILKW